MILAVISDLHANFEACKKVFADIRKQGVDEIICLGDLIDYGAKPQEIIELIIKEKIPCVLGNHDAALFDREVLRWFNDNAVESSKYSRKHITVEEKAFLQSLPLFLDRKEAYYVHGFPPDSYEIYVSEATAKELQEAFTSFTQQVCFVGHTHLLETIMLSKRGKITRSHLVRSVKLKPSSRYIINVGSVGQPRDDDNRASYVLYDVKKQIIRVRRITYDVQTAKENILEAGLSKENAAYLD